VSTPNRNDLCPCGSGKKYKKCHMGTVVKLSNVTSRHSVTAILKIAHDLFNAKQWKEAENFCRLALSARENDAQAYFLLGLILVAQNRKPEAAAAYQSAIRHKSAYFEAMANLGQVLLDLGQINNAAPLFKEALLIPALPPHAKSILLNNLGNALSLQGKSNDAIVAYEEAISLDPDSAHAYNNLGAALQGYMNFEVATKYFKKALTLKPSFTSALQNLIRWIQLDSSATPAQLQTVFEKFREQQETPLRQEWRTHDNMPLPGKRLRIAYVSPDFRQHAVAYFIEPVLAKHDRNQFELFCYYTHASIDNFTERLKSYADRWLDCQAMSDEQLAAQIRSDHIDILIDLAGHTDGGRLQVFARKPAPIQITYLGYPGSSGLSAMDYRLTDNYTDAVGSEIYYTEKLLRLPASLWCYQPDPGMPPVTPLPASRHGYLTFGSFNHFNKITDASIALWAHLLHETPASRLLMATVPDDERRSALKAQFHALGIDHERISIIGKLPTHEFHLALQDADIALDPLTVNGATTTCEALWSGVPTLSLSGSRFLSRAGLSILSAAGIPEFAATNTTDFIQLAKYYAENIPELADLRASLRERVAASQLTDASEFTRQLEQLYRNAWISWCMASDQYG